MSMKESHHIMSFKIITVSEREIIIIITIIGATEKLQQVRRMSTLLEYTCKHTL